MKIPLHLIVFENYSVQTLFLPHKKKKKKKTFVAEAELTFYHDILTDNRQINKNNPNS
jgi:hypothetical protein